MSTNQFFGAAFSLAFANGPARAQDPISHGDLILRAIHAGAYATRYTLERMLDGERVEVEFSGRGAAPPEVPVGTRVRAAGSGKEAVLRALMRAQRAR